MRFERLKPERAIVGDVGATKRTCRPAISHAQRCAACDGCAAEYVFVPVKTVVPLLAFKDVVPETSDTVPPFDFMPLVLVRLPLVMVPPASVRSFTV